MRILISGASKGLGKSLAKELAAAAYDLILVARSKLLLEELKQELIDNYQVDVQVIQADLSKKDSYQLLETNFKAIGHPDVVINNLGIYLEDEITQLNVETIDQQLELNFKSAVRITQLVEPYFKQKKAGIILNINSVMGIEAKSRAVSYSISKHALKAWSDTLRESYREFGVKVCSIYPGAINTTSWDGLEVDRSKMIQKEDIAKLVVSVLSLGPSTLVEEIRLSPLNF